MSRLGRRLRPVICLLTTALVGIGVQGCNRAPTQQPVQEETLPAAKLEMINQGDRLINEGEDLQAAGQKLNAEGKDGADLISQGDAKIAEGRAIKQRAMTMPD